MRTFILLMLVALMATACAEKKQAALSSPVTTESKGDSLPLDHPPVDLPPQSRRIKRMTVAMLANTLPVVAGNVVNSKPIVWTEKLKGQEQNVLQNEKGLSLTLGQPNYISTTSEPAEPSALYLKFMDDMARSVCNQMLNADQEKTSSDDRALIRFAELGDTKDDEAIRANLRYLMLRFWAQKVSDSDSVATDGLKTVFDKSAAGAKASQDPAIEGWRGVCVALYTSPSFHLY